MNTTFDTARTPLARRHEPVGRRGAAGKIAEPVARDQHLPDDLRRGQIAHERHRACVTERAIESAADLARDAERAAVRLWDVDALDFGALVERMRRRHPEQPFARAVGRNLFSDDVGPREIVAFRELVEERAGNVAHRGKLAHAAMIDPMPKLRDAHVALALGDAEVGQGAGDFGARRAREAHRRALLDGRDDGGHGAGF